MGNIKFADNWIQTVDLWCQKQPPNQQSHNHCPLSWMFVQSFSYPKLRVEASDCNVHGYLATCEYDIWKLMSAYLFNSLEVN